MLQKELILGIDIGSVSVSVISLDTEGEITDRQYGFHRGDVKGTLGRMLAPFEGIKLRGIASPSGKIRLNPGINTFDKQVCILEAGAHFGLSPRTIIHVGAERFFMMVLDEKGNYSHTRLSSSCAAGTGSFLDQQAVRLGLEHVSGLSEKALENQGPLPGIAARCSVFAKTDLIHAQQKGYGLGAICDSLCRGLADNIADTLFNQGLPDPPLLMTGGVSLNGAVVSHLEKLLGHPLEVHPQSAFFPVVGAACLLLKEIREGRGEQAPPLNEVLEEQGEKQYYFEVLEVPGGSRSREEHPDFRGRVRVDIYGRGTLGPADFYLGIDVGSTSTKAVLLENGGAPYAGFYTYTEGQPLKAVQTLFAAMDRLLVERGVEANILACGTTGSGRKFIGGIVGADQDVDEITAHARAAFELDPETDTIIEIGGQDAKFTRMKDGVVTFSHMNTVCAAGTGSFLEELAGRLGVKLEDYEAMALGNRAPLASDRCTVFMERDINQLLSQGYRVEEVMATVIHSVRENYLKKVAGESRIGKRICFQGATAKNRALVAAFEQKLGRPVFVSPLCHLTGALGTALILKEEHRGKSHFRGLGLHRREIPVRTEQCELCLNRCTLSVAAVNGEKLAYGFQCGRDYETNKFVAPREGGFDPLKARRKLVRELERDRKDLAREDVPSVGIPAVLHLVGDLFFWKAFFRELGIKVLTTENFRDSLKRGKQHAGAEFCAPMVSMYGHVDELAQNCGILFMPIYLESRDSEGTNDQNFCYYTQYSASLVSMGSAARKLVAPLLNFSKKTEYNATRLRDAFRKAGLEFDRSSLARALVAAGEQDRALREHGCRQFGERFTQGDNPSVMLLGRPYVLFSDSLNKGIPGIFASMGVDAFFQEMLDQGADAGGEDLSRLLAKVPWHFASTILRTAEQVCRTPGLYPVLVTAFKCAPDSFIQEYFKQIMELYGKPYLVIQIDEHDSNVGYETRIEAALRSFRNHMQNKDRIPLPSLEGVLPTVETKIGNRVLLLPEWDTYVSPLVAANLRRGGYDARVLHGSPLSIRRSMAHNTGQCLPINIIAQDYMDYLEKHKLDPSGCILWMMEARLTCNIRQYPYFIKRILEQCGNGMEMAAVYSGELTHRELSLGITYYAYFAYMLGGLFRKVACRIRPYEYARGQTDEVADEVQQLLLEALEGGGSIEEAVRKGMSLFREVAYDSGRRKPLVAIFGDFYVRDNDVMNQDLVRDIEDAGGEALITPYHDYTKLNIENIFRRAIERGERVETGFNRIILNLLKFMDDRFYRHFAPVLGPAPVIRARELEKKLAEFRIDLLHSGESYDNLLKIFYIVENYPEVSLFVQTNPSFCCPALVTEAMTGKIREMTGVPVLTLTYDGTSDSMNEAIVPYIRTAAMAAVDGSS